ncbi:MAG: cytochrome c oxidase cbb3-type subunit 4 [Crocinitomicaceae bacterium]|jgi:cytochrome c oxidase cbb3-type subunit 4
MTEIEGISIYPILSLLIFTLFFAVMLTYVFRMKKSRIEEMGEMPLEDSSKDVSTNFLND